MSPGFLGFALVCSGAHIGCRVHFGSCGFTRVRAGSPGSFEIRWVYLGTPSGLLVHSLTRGFTRAREVFAELILGSRSFILARVVSPVSHRYW